MNTRISEGTINPLISGVQEENAECVKELLRAGVDVNATDGVDTALMVACETGNEAIVKLLLEAGADVNAENSTGMTALYLAVIRGHAEFRRAQTKKDPDNSLGEINTRFSAQTNMVFLLLKAGAHVQETTSGLNPYTVHLQPSHSGTPNFHILRMLSAAGASIEEKGTPAMENNLKSLSRDCIREHLKRIHPEKNLYVTVGQLGIPILMQSFCLYGTLTKKAHCLNYDEKEFLSKTSERDNDNVLNLINTGVDVNVQDENGMTGLMKASQTGNVELIEELIRVGANVNIQNIFGNTALICATLNWQNECVLKLLENGANTKIQGKDGLTALMYAAKNGNINSLQTLIEGGADPNIPNEDDDANQMIRMGKRGTTAIIYAARAGNTDCVKNLIEAGADVNNDNDSEGNTLLISAIKKGKADCIKELIQGGADFNITHENNLRALLMASVCKRDHCFSELMKAGVEVDPSILGDIARQLLDSEDREGKENKTNTLLPSLFYLG